MTPKHSILGILCLSVAVLIGVQAYASAGGGQSSAAVLKERANQYWQHKVKQEMAQAFKFEDPQKVKGYNVTRYVQTLGGGAKWLGAKVEQVHIEGDNAVVLMKIRYLWTFVQNAPKQGFESKVADRWRLVDGTWYHEFQNPKGELEKMGAQKVDAKKPADKAAGKAD